MKLGSAAAVGALGIVACGPAAVDPDETGAQTEATGAASATDGQTDADDDTSTTGTPQPETTDTNDSTGGLDDEVSCEVETLVEGQQYLYGIQLRGDHVYWLAECGSSEPGAFRRVPRSGGAAETLATVPCRFGLLADDTHGYWSDGPNLHRHALDPAGALEDVVVTGLPKSTPTEWTLIRGMDDEFLYLMLEDPTRLHRAPKAGGASSEVHAFAEGMDAVVRDGATMLVGLVRSRDIVELDLVDGTTRMVASNVLASLQVAEPDFAYLAGFDGGVGRLARADGAFEILYPDSPEVREVALDDGWLYWSSAPFPGPLFLRAPAAGEGPVQTLCVAEPELSTELFGFAVLGLAFDATHIYWTTGSDTAYGGGIIKRMAK